MPRPKGSKNAVRTKKANIDYPFPNHLRFHQEYWLHRSRPKYYFGLYKALSAYEAQIFLQLLRQLPATALWQAFHRKNPI